MGTFMLLKIPRGGVPLWAIRFGFLLLSSYLVADMVIQHLRLKYKFPAINLEQKIPSPQNHKIKSSETRKSILEILYREKPKQSALKMGLIPPSMPNFKLIGTVVGKGVPSYAIFKNPLNNEQIILKKGDLLSEDVVIKQVVYGKIFLSIGGRLTPVEIDYGAKEDNEEKNANIKLPPLKPFSDLNKVLDKREIELAMKDLSKVMTQARVVPYLVRNKAAGFRVFSIKPGSIYTKVGLKNGDILQAVNDVELNSPEKLYMLFQQLRNEPKINLAIMRRGQRITIPVEVR